MSFGRIDLASKEWKQLVAWFVATLVMPIVALPIIEDTNPDLGFEVPVVLILCVAWGISSYLLHLFIKEHID